MHFNSDLWGVLRFEVRSYRVNLTAFEETDKLAGPFNLDECVAWLQSHPVALQDDEITIWAFDMDGYQDEALWTFYGEYPLPVWLARNGVKLGEAGNQLSLFEEE